MASALEKKEFNDDIKTPSKNDSRSVVIEGWLYKKANVKLQGYKRRWANIYSDGIFYYSKGPTSPCRPAIDLKTSTISSNKKRYGVVVDSEKYTLHLKYRHESDFKNWLTVFDSFVSPSQPSFYDESISENKNIVDPISGLKSARPVENLSKELYLTAADNLSKLSSLVVSFLNELDRASSSQVSSNENDTIHPNVSENFVKRQITYGRKFKTIIDDISTRVVPTLFKEDLKKDIYIQALTRNLLHCRNGKSLIKKAAVQSIDVISNLNSLNMPDPRTYNYSHKLLLPEIDTSSNIIHSHSLINRSASRASAPYPESNDEEFFDALEDCYLKSNAASDLNPSSTTSNSSSYDEESFSKTNTYDNDADSRYSGSNTSLNDVPVCDNKQSTTSLAQQLASSYQRNLATFHYTCPFHRTSLPAPEVPVSSRSLYSLLKKCIGKDLTRISMPVSLNEPLGSIQKLCQQFEYCELLEKAAATNDPALRMCYIAAFAVSVYSVINSESGRKPSHFFTYNSPSTALNLLQFNPLLGETFEMLCSGKNIKFVGEKVNQYPATIACHMDGKGYAYSEQLLTRARFWGKSLEFVQDAFINLSFTDYEERYTWNKLNTCIRSIFSNKYDVDTYGVKTIKSYNDSNANAKGYSCVLNFEDGGYFRGPSRKVSGSVIDKNGKKVYILSGTWDQFIQIQPADNSQQPEMLWDRKSNDIIEGSPYGYTPFALCLNELTDELRRFLPATDSRLRPDQSFYERGMVETADSEKVRIEQKQRATRKTMETEGLTWKPMWFDLVNLRNDRLHSTTHQNKKVYMYNHKYWQKRGEFGNEIPNIW